MRINIDEASVICFYHSIAIVLRIFAVLSSIDVRYIIGVSHQNEFAK